jgi:hypothetical protein
MTAARARTTLGTTVRWTLFIVVLGFVAYALSKQIAQIDWSTVRFRPLPIVGAALCLLAVPPVQLLSYRTLLGAYAHEPPLRVMAAVAWIPPLGKYIPGKVASVVGAVYLLKRFGIPAAVALGVVLVMDGLAVVSGLVTGSPLLLFEPLQSAVPLGWLWCVLVALAGIICLHPGVFGRILSRVLRWTGRPELARMPDLLHYILPVVCAFGQWVLAGAAMWLIANSLTPISAAHLPRFIAIAALGYTISYLMLFAPGGLGPREAIFQLALSTVMPSGLAAVSVVAMRIIQTLTELAAALAGVIALRRTERNDSGH